MVFRHAGPVSVLVIYLVLVCLLFPIIVRNHAWFAGTVAIVTIPAVVRPRIAPNLGDAALDRVPGCHLRQSDTDLPGRRGIHGLAPVEQPLVDPDESLRAELCGESLPAEAGEIQRRRVVANQLPGRVVRVSTNRFVVFACPVDALLFG